MREKALEEFSKLNTLEITEVNRICSFVEKKFLSSLFLVRFTMDSSIK